MSFVILLGHLGADPETRFTPSGQKVTNMRLATNARSKGNDVTTWWNVEIWGDHPLIQYLKKGSAIVVNGEMIEASTYQDKNTGQARPSLQVRARDLSFPPFGKGGERGDQQPQQQQNYQQQQQRVNNGYNEQPYAQNQASYASAAPMGGSPFSNASDEEDPLPF